MVLSQFKYLFSERQPSYLVAFYYVPEDINLVPLTLLILYNSLLYFLPSLPLFSLLWEEATGEQTSLFRFVTDLVKITGTVEMNGVNVLVKGQLTRLQLIKKAVICAARSWTICIQMYCHCFHLLLSFDVHNVQDLFDRDFFVILTAPLPCFFLSWVKLTNCRRSIVIHTNMSQLVIRVQKVREILKHILFFSALVHQCNIAFAKNGRMVLFKRFCSFWNLEIHSDFLLLSHAIFELFQTYIFIVSIDVNNLADFPIWWPYYYFLVFLFHVSDTEVTVEILIMIVNAGS